MLRRSLHLFTAATALNGGVPQPKGLPLIGNLKGFIDSKGNPIVTFKNFFDECGDTFVFKIPGTKMVVTRDHDLMKKVLLGQTQYTRRPPATFERLYKDHGWPDGIGCATGQNWKNQRKESSKLLLTLGDAVNHFLPKALAVSDRLKAAIDLELDERTAAGDKSGLLVSESPKNMIGLASSEVSSKAVFGVDVTLLKTQKNQVFDPESLKLARILENTFENIRLADSNPLSKIMYTKELRELTDAMKFTYEFAKKRIGAHFEEFKKTGEIPKAMDPESLVPRLFLQYKKGELSEDVVLWLGGSIMSAAIDSTAQTTEWFLYNLCRNPRYIDLIREERTALEKELVAKGQVLSDGRARITAEEWLHRLPMLRACQRESMRLTPSASATARLLEKPFTHVINGKEVLFEKGTGVVVSLLETSHDPRYLREDPQAYYPERFLTKGDKECPYAVAAQKEGRCPAASTAKPHDANVTKKGMAAYAGTVPFGHGASKCLGAGFGRMATEVWTSTILMNYDLTYTGPEQQLIDKLLIRPTTPIGSHLTFKKRA